MILKPFMLRRVKREVENEMAPKIELEVPSPPPSLLFPPQKAMTYSHLKIPCQLTVRQRKLYNGIKEKISLNELLENSSTEQGLGHLMNLVMQFRKVLALPPFSYPIINSSSPPPNLPFVGVQSSRDIREE